MINLIEYQPTGDGEIFQKYPSSSIKRVLIGVGGDFTAIARRNPRKLTSFAFLLLFNFIALVISRRCCLGISALIVCYL